MGETTGILAHNLGFPRIGAGRELKRALEAYWRGETGREALEATGRELRERHLRLQAEKGLDLVPVGDFSFYDHVLDTTCLLGALPRRLGTDGPPDLDDYFRMARGRAPRGKDVPACEMTKWFDTNYHFIVPELRPDLRFEGGWTRLLDEVREAAQWLEPRRLKPVLVGPLTWLWLGKPEAEPFDRLTLLEPLAAAYGRILSGLQALGVEWVQLDEPVLALDLPAEWRQAFESLYSRLQVRGLRVLLATYFGALEENLELALRLPVDGIHLDLVRAPGQLEAALDRIGPYKVLSAGVVDGRNVWRADLGAILDRLEPARERLGGRLWVAPSCSLLHVPVDAALETGLDEELRGWLAFAVQKLEEVALVRDALREGRAAHAARLEAAREARAARLASARTRDEAVRARTAAVTEDMARRRSPYPARRAAQRARLELPPLPTTTIGSFPQTPEIRRTRRAFRAGELGREDYERAMKAEIERCIRFQERVGLDVLVHGEPERNDMVEYFGEQLAGFAFTRNGWVQSYGSRCVKPPLIYGDVSRPRPMTVDWIAHAQSLTDRPVKGMLTGPVTILQWSFVRDDLPRETVALQIALAIRDEVADLEAAGIRAIQIDEPAFREGLPLRRRDWPGYLDWAVRCFRIASAVARDETQIHTHMCYSEFNDVIEAIAAMDADVISIEASRSRMELLEAFARFDYPNEIGPGVWDIHSPRVPPVEEMEALLRRALERIPAERLWVNPDCGLKTRDWPEVEQALAHMVEAARRVRATLARAAS